VAGLNPKARQSICNLCVLGKIREPRQRLQSNFDRAGLACRRTSVLSAALNHLFCLGYIRLV